MKTELKHIDKDLLMDVFGDDEEMICETIDVFVSMAEQYSSIIDNAYNSKNWFELGVTAHKAKASCRTMGMSDLGDCLDKIELNAKGLAYEELKDERNLLPDYEKLFVSMVRDGHTSGERNIVDSEIDFFKNNFHEAIKEINILKNNFSDFF